MLISIRDAGMHKDELLENVGNMTALQLSKVELPIDRVTAGPSWFIVDLVEFSVKENHRARQRTLPTNSWTFVALDRC